MLGLFLVSKLSLQLIRIHQSVIYMILNTSSCLLHVYISIGVTWLHLLGRSWEWFNREVSQDEGCFTVGLVDPGGESSQHSLPSQCVEQCTSQCGHEGYGASRHSLIFPSLLCSLCWAWEAIVMLAMTAALLVLALGISNGGVHGIHWRHHHAWASVTEPAVERRGRVEQGGCI